MLWQTKSVTRFLWGHPLHFFTRFLLNPLLALVLITTQVMGKATPPDARIILIDFGYFSAINSRSERHRAIDDMVSDIGMFHSQEPAVGFTFILAPSGVGNIRTLAKVRSGESPADALTSHRNFEKVRSGTFSKGSLLDLNDIRPAVFNAIGDLGFTRRNRRDSTSTLDIHVFAPGWRISSVDGTQNVMRTHQATQCVIERGPRVQSWPKSIFARFEFRIPEGVEVPSDSATAAFIGSVTGYATQEHFIFNRGAKGPLCAMDEPVLAKSYIDVNMQDDLNCKADVQNRSARNETTFACRKLAPQMQAIDPTLQRGPVALVLRPSSARLTQPRLISGLSPHADLVIRIGTAVFSAGGAAGTIPSQIATPSLLVLNGRAGCRKGTGGEVTFGAANVEIHSVLSRYYCTDTELQLGLVELN